MRRHILPSQPSGGDLILSSKLSPMTYFEDLTSCSYNNGPHDARSWDCPLLAVGWLEASHPFAKGTVSGRVVDKLVGLGHPMTSNFKTFRGLHQCSVCTEEGEDDNELLGSHFNLFVPGNGEVFFAPGRIDHYILRHSYRPPGKFVDALMQCPYPGSLAFFQRLDEANGGIEAPLMPTSGKRPVR